MLALPEEHRTSWRSLQYFVRRYVLRQSLITANVEPTGLRVRAYSRDFLGRHLFKRGVYERDLTEFVLRHLSLRDDAVILDIGANLGWYSMLLGKRCPRARIHAFEPEPRNLALLRENLQQNGIANVTVHPVAVAERSGTMQFFPYAEKNMGRHSLVAQEGCTPIDVRVVALDEFLPAVGVQPEQVDLVKIDVEGYELPALRGAQRLLRGRPVIVAEFAPKYMRRAGIDPESFLRLFRDAGFTAHQFSGGVLRPETLQGASASDRRLDLIWQKEPVST
jgi:FkbM family methyltransferase